MNNEVGYVISSRNFLIYLDGMPSIRINDLVQNDQGVRGWVNALYPDKTEILVLDEGEVFPGQMFKRMPQRLSVSVGEYLLGRAINPLGVAIDGKKLIAGGSEKLYELDKQAPGIESREFIKEQFLTGLTMIDTLIPLGKGQRELVIGDAHSGKTSFLIDLIVNQKNTRTICIYAAIGKPITAVRSMIDILNTNGALEHTIIISASATEPAPLIYLTPQTAFTVAEYFQQAGRDVLLILDDIGNHAKIYREISLLSNKPPGKESYPGDIFYQHAHLMERAGKFKKEYGGGAITAIPVLELNLNDFTSLVPTNIMAMTDGHLMFKSELQNKGLKPAIDVSLSVSRVGRQTQNRVQNGLSTKIRLVLAQATDLETVSRFSAELPYETQLILRQKSMIEELLKQDSLTLFPIELQVAMLGLVFTSFLEDKNEVFLKKYKNTLLAGIMKDPELSQALPKLLNLENEEALFKYLDSWGQRLSKICGV